MARLGQEKFAHPRARFPKRLASWARRLCARSVLATALLFTPASPAFAYYYNLGGFWQNGCGSKIKLVQAAGPTYVVGDSQSLSLPQNENSGDLLIAAVSVYTTRAADFSYTVSSIVTDSAGNTWYPGPVWNNQFGGSSGGIPAIQFWYAPGIQAGANTVSATLLPTDPGPDDGVATEFTLAVLEYSGLAATDVVDVSQSTGGSSNGGNPIRNIASGNMTTTTSCDLVVGALADTDDFTATFASGWRTEASDTGDLPITYIVDNLPAGSRANSIESAQATLSSSDQYWEVGEMAFRAAATTAPPQPTQIAFTTTQPGGGNQTWQCSQNPVTVTAENSSGVATNTSTGLYVDLTGSTTYSTPAQVEEDLAYLPNTASGTATANFGTATTSGELIVVAACNTGGNDFPSNPVTDSGSGSYTLVFDPGSLGNFEDCALWYRANAPAGITSVSVTESSSAGHGALWAAHYKNIATANVLDTDSAYASAGASPWASGSILTYAPNDLLIGVGNAAYNSSNCNMTVNGAWTADSVLTSGNWDSNNGGEGVFGHQIASSAGGYQFSGTDSGNCNHYMGIAAFKAASAGINYFYDSSCQYPISASTGFTHIQGTASNLVQSGNTVSVSLPNNPAQGDLVACGATFWQQNGSATMSASDGNGNAYTVSPHSPDPGGTAFLFYLNEAPSNASKTINVEFGGDTGWSVVWCDEFSTGGGVAVLDTDIGAESSSGTSPNTPSISPATPNELSYSVCGVGGTLTSINSPWTGIVAGDEGAAYDTSVSSPLAVNFTGNADGGTGWDCMEMAFKDSPSVGSPALLIGAGTNSASYYFESAAPVDNTVTVSDPSLTSNLVAWYKFDDTSGADSSGNAHTLTLNNGPTLTSGMINGALQFDGTSQYGETSANVDVNSTSFTVTAWVNVSSNSNNPAVIYQASSGANTVGWFMSAASGNLDFYSGSTLGYISANSPFYGNAPPVTPNQWTHVAIVGTSSSTSAYVNGILQGTASVPTFNSTNYKSPNSPIYVGYTPTLSTYYGGMIDDLRLYDVALTQEQIVSVMNDREVASVSQTETISVADYTWIGSGSGCNSPYNWSNGNCWSNGAGAPNNTETAIFDGNCVNCSPNMTGNIDVGGIWMHSDYTGTISPGTYNITTENSFEEDGGTLAFPTSPASSGSFIAKGSFILTGGSFTAPDASGSWTVAANNSSFAVSGTPTFNANGGTLTFPPTDSSVTVVPGTVQYDNVTFAGTSDAGFALSGTMNIAGDLTMNNDSSSGFDAQSSGTTLAVAGNVYASGGEFDNGPQRTGYTTTLALVGTGNQSIIGTKDCLPGSITIDNMGTSPNNVVTLPSTIAVHGTWLWVAGSVNAASSTLVVSEPGQARIDDSVTQFNNVTFNATNDDTPTVVGTLNVGGNLVIGQDSDTGISGGTISVAGNVSMTQNQGGSASITFTGGNAQTITRTGGTLPTGAITVNKPPGISVSLGSNLVLSSGQALNVVSGALDLNGYNLTGNPVLTVGTGASAGLVQSVGPGFSPPTTTSATLSQNETVGNTLVAAVYWDAYPTVTLTDTAGNSWTPLGIYGGNLCDGQGTGYDGYPYIQLWYAPVTVGGANTINVNETGSPIGSSSDGPGVFVAEYSGLSGLDVATGQAAPSASNAMSTGNLITSAADLIAALFMDPNGNGFMTAGSGFTSRLTDHNYYSMFEDNAPSGASAGTIDPGSNLPSGSDSCWQGAAAAFSIAAATVKAQGGETVTATKTFNTGSTALYYGSASYPSLNLGKNYANLAFDNASGNWKAGGTTTVTGALSISAGTLQTAGNNMTLNNVTNAGTLDDGSDTLSVSGNWSNTGTYSATAGSTVDFTSGASHAISGSTSFNNLTMDDSGNSAADTLTFQHGQTQTVSGALTLKGNSSNDLKLRSNSTGTQWDINPSGTRTIANVDVEDSDNTNATVITDNPGVNSGDNTNWAFGIQLLASTIANDNANGLTTSAINTSGASLIVLAECIDANSTPPTPTDSQGNTWQTGLSSYGGTSEGKIKIYYAYGPTTSSTHTFTDPDDGFNSIAVMAFSGTSNTSSVYDTSNGNKTTTGDTLAPGSVTPIQDGELVVTFACSTTSVATSETINDSFSIAQTLYNGNSNDPEDMSAAYWVTTSTSAVNPTWTFTGDSSMTAAIVTFKIP